MDDALEAADWEQMRNAQWRSAVEEWNKHDESGAARILLPPLFGSAMSESASGLQPSVECLPGNSD